MDERLYKKIVKDIEFAIIVNFGIVTMIILVAKELIGAYYPNYGFLTTEYSYNAGVMACELTLAVSLIFFFFFKRSLKRLVVTGANND